VAGESGLRSLRGRGNGAGEYAGEFDALPSTVAGVVDHGPAPHQFQVDPKVHRNLAKFMQYAMVAADEALRDAQWPPQDPAAAAAAGEVTVRPVGETTKREGRGH